MNAISTVKNYYSAFNDKNWEEMLAHIADDVVHEPNQGEPRHGKALFRDFMRHMDASYEETLKDLVLFAGEAEGRIAAEFVVHGIYKQGEPGLPQANGQCYVLPAGAFLEVADGKITRITTYYNLEKWIALVSCI